MLKLLEALTRQQKAMVILVLDLGLLPVALVLCIDAAEYAFILSNHFREDATLDTICATRYGWPLILVGYPACSADSL